MNTLPVEIVGLIIGNCPAIVQPLAALVCREWNEALKWHRDLLPAPDLAHFYRPLPYDHMCRYVPQCRRAQDADYKDRLGNAKRTAYACRLVKTGHRALIEWAFTEGRFIVTGEVLSKAAATGNLDLVKWLVARCGNSVAGLGYHIARGAAKSGSIDILEWAHVDETVVSTGTTFIRTYKRVIDMAAKYNQRETIGWLLAHGHPLDIDVSVVAAAAGHVDLLRWLNDRHCPVRRNLVQVASGLADLDTFDWFGERDFRLHQIAYREAAPGDFLARLGRVYAHNRWIGPDAWLLAAERGDLAMCEWLFRVNCPRDNYAFERAIHYRHLDVVLWLRDHGFMSTPLCFCQCALKGDIDALEWLSHHGFHIIGSDMACVAASQGHMDVLEWLHVRDPTVDLALAADAAARANRWATVQWLCDRGCKLVDPGLCARAVGFKRLDMIEYLRAHGCPWNESSCAEAAVSGQLEALQWLRARGCPWGVLTCESAIRERHYAIAEWTLDHGCPYDASLCATVAMQDALHYLKRLRERGIPWDHVTCKNAAHCGHLETLQWAIANGCPHALQECREEATGKGHQHVVDWIDGLLLLSP